MLFDWTPQADAVITTAAIAVKQNRFRTMVAS